MDNESKILELLSSLVVKIEDLSTKVEDLGKGQVIIEQRLDRMETRLDKLELNQDEIKKELKGIKVQAKENVEFITSLVHSSELAKAKEEALKFTVVKLEGEVTGLCRKLTAASLALA